MARQAELYEKLKDTMSNSKKNIGEMFSTGYEKMSSMFEEMEFPEKTEDFMKKTKAFFGMKENN